VKRLRLALFFSGILVAPVVPAEVVDAAAGGFSIRHSVEIAAPRADVWFAATDHIGEWWSDDHTVSGDAGRMSIDAKPQGCFCETLGPRSGVVHMTVTFVNPAVMLRMSGGLGPLGLMGTAGNMTWEFDDSETGTTLTLRYAVGGYLPQGLDQIAAAVDGVLAAQLDSLKRFAETRRPRSD